ncbi:MAG: hypothetical protein ACRDC6_15145, partial [Shewanella sp.]
RNAYGQVFCKRDVSFRLTEQASGQAQHGSCGPKALEQAGSYMCSEVSAIAVHFKPESVFILDRNMYPVYIRPV